MIVFGKNPVNDILLINPSLIREIYLVKETPKKRVDEILTLAERKGIPISRVSRADLDKITNMSSHQGIAADIADFEYSGLGGILKNDSRFYLVLDHIEDPHNLGAIIRTASFFDIGGIFIPKDRAAGITPAVVKTSSGAVMTIPVCRVSNIGNVINELKKNNVWIVGADASGGKTLAETDVKGLDIALVIGSEGAGLSKKIKEQCDFLVTVQGAGKVESLNASVAAGILINELKKKL